MHLLPRHLLCAHLGEAWLSKRDQKSDREKRSMRKSLYLI